jgi:Rps23 Pro-64 3,4-dihydroxylase Tpa1-like proline 4-hydroxylase
MEMILTHVCDPCEYIVLDNVCSEQELTKCFLEADLISPSFEDQKNTGSAKDEKENVKKQNKGVFFRKIYTPDFAFVSPISIQIHKAIETLKTREYTALSQMNFLKSVFGYDVLLSAYKNGDHYKSHNHASVLSLLFWFGKENFTGGDLVFSHFNHTVPFKSNRAILFPSYYNHQITEVKSDSEDYVRYCVTAFLLINGTLKPEQPMTTGTAEF